MAERPLTYAGVVHQWECDHMGHLNIMHYVAKFDHANWNFFTLIGLTAERMRELHIGMAGLEQNLKYRRELLPGDAVAVRTHLIEAKEKTLSFFHEMSRRDTGEVAATCELLAVCMDTAARRARPLPGGVAERARELFSIAQ